MAPKDYKTISLYLSDWKKIKTYCIAHDINLVDGLSLAIKYFLKNHR